MRAITPAATRGAWLTLLALTGLSYALSYAHLGALGVPAALLIAGVKGTLVVVVFMELGVERFSVKMTLVVSAVFVAILVTLMVSDVATRGAPPLVPPP